MNVIGIVISILITLSLSKTFIQNIVNNILIVIKAVHNYLYDDKLSILLDGQKILSIASIQKVGKKSESEYSDLERSLKCNITLFVWFFAFLMILVLFQKINTDFLNEEQILMSLTYVVLIPYLFRIFWNFFDKKNKTKGQFLSSVNNKISAARYPVMFFWGILTFQFLFLDYYKIYSSIDNLLWVIGIIIAVILFTYLIMQFILRIFRIYSVQNFEFKTGATSNDFALYFLAIKQEVYAFATSVFLSALLAFSLPLFPSFIFNIKWLYFLPIIALFTPIITFYRIFKFKEFKKFIMTD